MKPSPVEKLRDFFARPDVRRWVLPYRKPLAGTIAGAITLGAREAGVLDLPAGLAELAAYTIVSYLVPETVEEVVLVPADMVPIDELEAVDTGEELPPFTDQPPSVLRAPDVPAKDDPLIRDPDEEDGTPGSI